MIIDLSCPVENHCTIVKNNQETNEPYLLLKLFNLSEKTINSINFHVYAYDLNGTELGTVPVFLEGLSASPRTYFAETKAISLVGIDDAKNFIVSVDSVIFDDETEYLPSETHTINADNSEASIDDAMLLREFVPEAVCYASEYENYWRCVCGRANFPNDDTCIRCERSKNDVLSDFSSRDALNDTIARAQAEEERMLREEEERLRIEKELKKAKIKKTAIISVSAIFTAAVIAILGIFTYRITLNIIGDKAVKNGDYLKAYESYKKTGTDKISEVTKLVQGNTPENLLFQSGIAASDDENLYYLTLDASSYNFSLVKENKISKEKTTLTDAAGGSLNITKDWVYFVDVENGYVKRISKDGKTIENVIDTGVNYFSLIGSDVYYIKMVYDNPNNLPEEQCELLASQGQMATFNHLYKMNLDNKRSTQISKENMISISIYGDRIYYLTENEETWKSYNLHSMNLNGKDKKVVVDTPVASFLIKDNNLYYIKMYNDSSKGKEIESANDLNYSIVRKNLEDNSETVIIQEYMVTYLNSSEESLFFIGFDRETYMNSLSSEDGVQISTAIYSLNYATGEIKQMLAGDVQIFNIADDNIILFLSGQGMCRLKTDSTGFEQLYAGNDVLGIETENTDSYEEFLTE